MGNMLYNGVELPALPTNDEFLKIHSDANVDTILKYHFISTWTNSAGVTIYDYYCTNTPVVLNSAGKFTYSYRPVATARTSSDNLVWRELSYNSSTSGTVAGQAIIWANHDVLLPDNTVYLAASEPVDPNAPTEPTYDRTAFLSGLAMGLCGKGDPTFEGSDTFSKGYKTGAALRRKRVLPVAYLYNGVRLSNINKVYTPELQKTYPYAVITRDRADGYMGDSIDEVYDGSEYSLCVTDKVLKFTDGSGGSIWYNVRPIVAFETNYQRFDLKTDGELTDPPTFMGGGIMYAYSSIPVWSNYTLVNETSMELPEPSEPVPVYE